MLKPVVFTVGVTGFVWLAIFGDQGLYQLHKTRHHLADLGKEAISLENTIKKLEEDKALLSNPKHLEWVIRQELGYVKSGEVVFQQMSP